MTNTVTKKLAIALLTMVMLVSLMVGGTYAYFTDSVSIDGNIITAGDIEVDAKLYGEGATLGTYDVALTKIALDDFAPGDSKTYKLEVINTGSLDADYKVVLTTTDDALLDALTITYDGATMNIVDGVFQTDWEKIEATEPDTAVELSIVITFNTGAGNEYENAKFQFDIDVLATQVGATSNVVYASTVDAINNATAGQTVILASDITSTTAVALTEAVNFDLNGKTLTVPSFKMETSAKATVDIANGTIMTDTSDISVLVENGTVNITDVTLATYGKIILDASTNTINLNGATKFVKVESGVVTETAVAATIQANTRVVVGTDNVVSLKAETADAKVTVEGTAMGDSVDLTEDEIEVFGTIEVATEGALIEAIDSGKNVLVVNDVEVNSDITLNDTQMLMVASECKLVLEPGFYLRGNGTIGGEGQVYVEAESGYSNTTAGAHVEDTMVVKVSLVYYKVGVVNTDVYSANYSSNPGYMNSEIDIIISGYNGIYNSCFNFPATIGGKNVTAFSNYSFYANNYSEAVEAVNIPEGVKYIGKISFAHSSISEIVLPDSVEFIAWEAFGYCQSLKNVVLGKNARMDNEINSYTGNADGKEIGFYSEGSKVFVGCNNILKFEVSAENEKLCVSSDGRALMSKGTVCTTVDEINSNAAGIILAYALGHTKDITLPDEAIGIANRAFENTAVESVDLNNVFYIAANAFKGASQLTETPTL